MYARGMRTTTGTRAEIEDQITELVEGWEHLGNYKRRAEAYEALSALRRGDTTVTAGHSVYVVATES